MPARGWLIWTAANPPLHWIETMGDADDMRKLITSGTKKWTKQRKAEERNCGARRMRSFRVRLQKELSLKDAAAAVMEKAYMKASANGTLPANARQVMYAARGEIQAMTCRRSEHTSELQSPDHLVCRLLLEKKKKN